MIEQPEVASEVSKYNEAGLQIMRLHNLWVKIEEHINKGEQKSWRFLLDSVWRELFADVYHLENPDVYIATNKLLKLKIAHAKDKEEEYELLNERHQFLKKLQDQVGKGGVFSDGTEDDFD